MPPTSSRSSLTYPPQTDSKFTTPRTSSPLNPSKAHLPLSPAEDDDKDESLVHKDAHLTSSPSLPLPETLDFMFRDRSHSRSPSQPSRDVLAFKARPSSPSSQLSSSWWKGSSEHTYRPWKGSPKQKKSVIPEQTASWDSTRTKVAQAAQSVLGTASDVTHELLGLRVELLEFAPIPGLQAAAETLLNIWDAVEQVDMNRLGCLRLTERCAETLLAVRQDIFDAGDVVGQELAPPIARLEESFNNVFTFLQRQIHQPFLKRYLKRNNIMKEIEGCDANLRDALGMFSLSIQIRILKQVSEAEGQHAKDTQQVLSAILSGRDPAPSTALLLTEEPENHDSLLLEKGETAVTHFTATPDSPSPTSFPAALPPSQVLSTLQSYHKAQNFMDAASDMRDLRQVIRAALQTTSDAQMLEVLQIGRKEMPDAIKTLQRALERVVERERTEEDMVMEESVDSPPRGVVLGKNVSRVSVKDDAVGEEVDCAESVLDIESPGASPTSSSSGTGGKVMKDALDREFIESGIDALRRMSHGMETDLPSWTITKYEIDPESKIGVGFFSDVYKGTCRGRTVAVKAFAKTTRLKLFVREIEIWKNLRHPNVLQLYGASSEAPWFFVSPYMKNGSLVEFLKRVEMDWMSGGGSTIPSPGLGDGSGTFGRSSSGVGDGMLMAHSRGTIPAGQIGDLSREWDLFRFMYEIAEGMEYLHSHGVLHGDLKAANVLVDDNIRCVISDFGQSERKSEALKISGTLPLHGTLRWQAPELLLGQSRLTAEMDVYAFAICCIEILSMGRMPWPLQDDEAVRHLVLAKDSRPTPHHHDSRFTNSGVQELLRICWHRDPTLRPPFSKIVRDIKQIRRNVGHVDLESPKIQGLPPLEEVEPRSPSPDMRPVELPPIHDVPLGFSTPDTIKERPSSSSITYQEAMTSGEPVTHTTSAQSSRSSSLLLPLSGSSSFKDEELEEYDGYDSPLPRDERIGEMRNERRYRLLLTHEYDASLILPLWDPSPVDLGAVGYLSKPRGRFITLFNAFNPHKSDHDVVRSLPSIYAYGQVKEGSQKLDKRSRVQQVLGAVTGPFAGLLTLRSRGDSQNVNRRYTYPLKAGHKIAVMCAETTEYRYLEQLNAPKKWFQANVDSVMNIYGMQHHIHKEDLFFVVGTLSAPNYALFVSHGHPDGHAHFSVYPGSPKTGEPWGTFTTDAEVTQEGGGPFHNNETWNIPCQSASKVSHQKNDQWDSVLLARLRFKPDHLEPTSDTIQETCSSPRVTHQEATVSRLGMTSGEPVIYTTSAQSSPSSSLYLTPPTGSSETFSLPNATYNQNAVHQASPFYQSASLRTDTSKNVKFASSLELHTQDEAKPPADESVTGKHFVIGAERALESIQGKEIAIEAAFNDFNISSSEYAILAGFNEALIRSGTGYLSEIHVFCSVDIAQSAEAFVTKLGEILSPLPGALFTPSSMYQIPVFKDDRSLLSWDELVYSYTERYAGVGSVAAPTSMQVVSYPQGSWSDGETPAPSDFNGNESKGSDSDKKDTDDAGNDEGDNEKSGDREDDDGNPDDENPDDPADGSLTSELPVVYFDVQAQVYADTVNTVSPKVFQTLQVDGRLIIQSHAPHSKSKRHPKTCMEFKKLKFQGRREISSTTGYKQIYARVLIDAKESLTRADAIKPSRTPARGRESTEVTTQQSSSALGFLGSVGLGSPPFNTKFSGHLGAESSSSQEMRNYGSRITQGDRNGVVWWGFNIDDPYEQEAGKELLDILPAVELEFFGENACLPARLHVEVASVWSLIPSIKNKKFQKPEWIRFGRSAGLPYSNLCQIVRLEIPSMLLESCEYKSLTEVKSPATGGKYDTQVEHFKGRHLVHVTPSAGFLDDIPSGSEPVKYNR